MLTHQKIKLKRICGLSLPEKKLLIRSLCRHQGNHYNHHHKSSRLSVQTISLPYELRVIQKGVLRTPILRDLTRNDIRRTRKVSWSFFEEIHFELYFIHYRFIRAKYRKWKFCGRYTTTLSVCRINNREI